MSILGKQKFWNMMTIVLLLSSLLQAAGVEAKVSTTEVVTGNPVKLQIKAVGENIRFPDILDIAGIPVTATSTESSSNFSYINGKLQSEKSMTRVLRFTPKQTMTIPSFNVTIDGKPYQTSPIELKVVKSHAPKMKKDELYDFVLKTDKKEVIVGESFVLTLFVSVSDLLQGAKLDRFREPGMQGFFVQSLGELKHYRQNGYAVVEKQYLLTAKQEGNFTIDAATVKLGEADLNRRDFFGRYGTKWRSIASNDLSVFVNPKPVKSDLVGSFTIDVAVDATEVKANKPVNLTVKISGEGSLEDFEFQKYEIDGVSVFSDEAKVESEVVDQTLHSTYTKTFAMISDADFTIPSCSFTVYNPKTQKVEKLEISSYRIKVNNPQIRQKPTLSAEETSASLGTDMGKSSQPDIKSPGDGSVAWWMLIAAFASGMAVMSLIVFLLGKVKKKPRVYQNEDALQVLYPHINKSVEIEEMVRKLYARKNGDKSIKIDKKALKSLIEKCTR